MPSRAEVLILQKGQQEVARLARRELAAWWATLDTSNPYTVKAEAEKFFPVLVREYGQVAETVAGDWYEQIYREAPKLTGMENAQRAKARARWALGGEFDGSPSSSLSSLQNIAGELIRQFGRDTVVQSARSNNRRFARVPAGNEPCAWCLMLASRGFAYHSEAAARPMTTSHYGTCNCEVVADDGVIPHGYDPDALYEMYSSVHSSGDTDKQVAGKLREKFDLK